MSIPQPENVQYCAIEVENPNEHHNQKTIKAVSFSNQTQEQQSTTLPDFLEKKLVFSTEPKAGVVS